jgi:nitrogen fixation/metabolism regulation signal transduction histidine kinase
MEAALKNNRTAGLSRFNWLREGLEGQSIRAVLRLYIFGLLAIAPFTAVACLVLGTSIAFKITPIIVLLFVCGEYLICYDTETFRKYWHRYFSRTTSIKRLPDDSEFVLSLKDLHLQQIDIAMMVREIQGTLKQQSRVRIEDRFPESLPAILADRERIQQVLLSLFINVGNAMPEGGKLILKGYASGKKVCLEADANVGMVDPKAIFKLFTESKIHSPEHGGGFGLGLKTTQAIVAAHGGDITSDLSQGVVVRLTLPLRPTEQSESPP